MCKLCEEAEKRYGVARAERARVYHMYESVRQEYYGVVDKCPDNKERIKI